MKIIDLVLRVAPTAQMIIFVFLLLYKNMGTCPETWAIPRYITKGDISAYDSFKSYSEYQASQRAKEILKNSDGHIMHFHPEPGIQMSLFLDRDYYWNELHYHNYRQNIELYYAKTKEELIEILKERNIKFFVMTYLEGTVRNYGSLDQKAKHLLPILLLARDSSFVYDPPFAYLK